MRNRQVKETMTTYGLIDRHEEILPMRDIVKLHGLDDLNQLSESRSKGTQSNSEDSGELHDERVVDVKR